MSAPHENSRARFASPLRPTGLVLWAALLGAAFLICHAAGLRDGLGHLTGTGKPGTSAAGALLYVLTYLGFVIVGPILLIAAPILGLLERRFGPPGRED